MNISKEAIAWNIIIHAMSHMSMLYTFNQYEGIEFLGIGHTVHSCTYLPHRFNCFLPSNNGYKDFFGYPKILICLFKPLYCYIYCIL